MGLPVYLSTCPCHRILRQGNGRFCERDLNRVRMTEFVLETNYPSRRIICQTDNSSKYKSEDEF